jgi:hypothetical protein
MAGVFLYVNDKAVHQYLSIEDPESEELAHLSGTCYFSIQTLLMTLGIIVLLLTNKEYVKKRFVSFGVKQITDQEYEHQRRHLTRQEVNKIKASKEYAHLLSQKGSMLDNWNWQSKESASNKRQKNKGD